ncbi:hypothetical protein COT20_00760 [bacterium (Candidatus Gribaldobacteria) CG08_land_8_20_14_0_20_39_15]|uniref:Uncharacterized protein n=1 Tax=bacterium (Candidatus Gribaldobacteria) CG08_land_8_20_14_0_20_39_15 TaxID=2014273 RepID=A0A2M6XV30_9BACT|nr:MAG: hypothetical protein COT20_00760 [bacterium (Candidatus Gribaldobacteria) CG08_land_8_20_14_0_20_39_15]
MNLSDIKNLISDEGKVVFVENDKIVGIFLSYGEYQKISSQKNCSAPTTAAANLPLFVPPVKEQKNEPLMSGTDGFFDEPVEMVDEEPKVIIEQSIHESEKAESVKADSDSAAKIKTEKELTVDDLPF